MPITPTLFVSDYPEFSNQNNFPTSLLNYWLNIAGLMLNANVWPTLAGPGTTAQGSFNFASQPNNNDTVTIGGTVVTFVTGTPVGNQVQIAPTLVDTISNLYTFLSSSNDNNLKKYTYYIVGSSTLLLAASNPGVAGNLQTIAASSGAITISGPTLTGGSSGRSVLDLGTELFVAHNLTLSQQSQKSANRNSPPGLTRGGVGSESAGGASVAYSQVGLDPSDSHWNFTVYGIRFIQLLRAVGSFPVQVGIGLSPVGAGGTFIPGYIPAYIYANYPNTTMMTNSAWPGPPNGQNTQGGPI